MKDKIIEERTKFYENSLKSYEMYIDKETRVVEKNMEHCVNRDKWFRNEVGKAWKTSIANRVLVLISLARTNIAKRDADEWIARM